VRSDADVSRQAAEETRLAPNSSDATPSTCASSPRRATRRRRRWARAIAS
jgi:hypothetical protein